jgi:ATP-binding cassette, subfamily F, member 3
VDVKKLEKQEAKLKAKIEKRSKRSMYEGSKLLDQQKKQQSYEEMFMKVCLVFWFLIFFFHTMFTL